MRPLAVLMSLGFAAGLLEYPGTVRADNCTTTNVQGSGANWTASIWKTNGAGTAAAPNAGNTYEEIFNGISIGNGVANTRVRNPATAGVQTFPGVSLTLDANTELRAKQSGATLNFPGVGGNPGLILNGGMLNGGDDATFPITGSIVVSNQTYISHGANGGGGSVSQNRAFTISGVLSGSGNMYIMNAGTTIAQTVSGNSNTYTGQWIVQCGWLRGTGTNSLGTNSITVDPLNTAYLADMPNATSAAGPAWFEPGYDMNSAGTLTLVNGGILRLHQNCIFSQVLIEGTPLSAGTHFYSELLASFPGNIAAGGSGSITVRPFGLAPVAVPPPQAQYVYAGGSAHFTIGALGAAPFTYQWRKNGVNLSDGGNITGSTTATLSINNVSSSDVANYDVVVSNSSGTDTSAPATLTLVTASGAYETAMAAALPVAFYQFNETGDPTPGTLVAYDNAGGYNAIYGPMVQNGNTVYNITGPTPALGFPGFSAGNLAAQFSYGVSGSRVTAMPWNLATNTVTLAAWINPNSPQSAFAGLIFSRGGDTVAGLNYSGSTDATGSYTLGYTWDNEGETYNWNSGLSAPMGQWSFVALVVTPTNATIYVMNANEMLEATHDYPHVVQTFGGTTLIGDDSNDGGNGTRGFSGTIDDVAVFNRALSKAELTGLFTAASGLTSFAPVIVGQPAFLNIYPGQTAQFTVAGGGSDPLTYQWQRGVSGSGVYTNLTDAGTISGSQTAALVVSNVSAQDAADYVVTLSNPAGSITSLPASLMLMTTSPAENLMLTNQQGTGYDWNSTYNGAAVAGFFDVNGVVAGATAWAGSNPGSTFEVMPGARLRSPAAPKTAVFPGTLLKVDGSGVWINNPGAGTPMGEFRFKQPTLGVGNGVVIFPKLVMNGGQLDLGNPGVVTIGGEIDLLTNTPIYNDNTADQGYLISAWITGSNTTSIEYHGYNQSTFQPGYSNNLNIACSSNAFSGKWNVVMGTLLATAQDGLGTNDITVGVNGALETTYDVNHPTGSLFLSGRMLLHQNDTFRTVFINGVPLAPGNYSFATLNTDFPTNFPATWTPQNGAAGFTAGSGSLTVLVQPAPTIIQQPQPLSLYPNQPASFAVSAQGNPPLGYQWFKGTTALTDGGTLSGSLTSNLLISSLAPGDAGNYTVVITNSIGSVTSLVATLTVLTTGPAENLTLNYDWAGAGSPTPIVQGIGADWNTVTNWSDGQPAAVSAYSNPGSTYDVVVGARLRSPAGTNLAIFPGNVITVEGSGTLENSTLNAVGELRFKHSVDPATNYFKKLVLNGGQLDAGDNGTIVVAGEIDVPVNSSIYVDNGAATDRGFQIDAWLTGAGNLLWHQFGTGLGGPCLNVTCPSNTFSGTWTVDQGVLLGGGLGSLGLNNITVGVNGSIAALETLYDMNSPQATLVLDVSGMLFLHQNDAFKAVTVAGTPLAPGTYTFAQLNASYPANFPASWIQQNGSTFSAGSGSLTVLGNSQPEQLQLARSGGNLVLTWSQGILLEATNLTGPWTTNTTVGTSITITPSEPQKFYRLLVP